MAVVIIATVGGVSSNSYVTLTRASTLIEQLPHITDWLTDVTIAKAQLLIHATRLIDRHILFYGTKASAAQALEWPRANVRDVRTHALISSTAIPSFVEWATVEWAYQLHLDAEQSDYLAPGLSSLRTPSFDAQFTGSSPSIVPSVVSDLLLPYGQKIPRKQRLLLRA